MFDFDVAFSVLFPFVFERIFVFSVGAGMFAHFICMAASAPTKSSSTVLVFLMTIAFCSTGMMASALYGDVRSMFLLLIGGISSMFLFWLWLWSKGMHVKDFLDKRYG